MDKIAVNLTDNKEINVDLIKELVGISKDYNVFELQKAIGTKDTEKAFRIINYFASNEKANPLVMVLSNLYGYFVKVYTAAYYGKKNDLSSTNKRNLTISIHIHIKSTRLAFLCSSVKLTRATQNNINNCRSFSWSHDHSDL